MLKILKTIFLLGLLAWQLPCFGQSKASDFFKDPSKEKDLLASLFKTNDRKQNPNRPFALDGEVGLLITTGNSDTSMIKLALDSSQELEDWSNRYEVQLLQRINTIKSSSSESGTDEIETTRILVSGQFDYKLTDETKRLFGYVEFDDNQFNLLREQFTAVTGWSQVMWQNSESQFRYSIGPGYSHFLQERTGTRLSGPITRGTLLYSLKFNKHARFRQEISAEVGNGLSKAQSNTSFTSTIFKKLGMKLSFNVVFNENVAEEDKVLSTQTSVSMVYQFF